VILAVVVLSFWLVYPPRERIRLGLDLAGGVHLVMRVDTDDALRLETETAAERMRLSLGQRGVAFEAVDVTGPTTFVVRGIDRTADWTDIAAEAEAVFERTPAPGMETFRMRRQVEATRRDEAVQQALHTIERRVNALGVAEPVVAWYGRGERILVELPGLQDVERAKRIIRSTSQLRLTLVERGPFATRDEALYAYGGALPSNLELLPGRSGGRGGTGDQWFVAQKAAAVAGTDLRHAQQSFDEYNRPAVAFTLSPQAARRFGDFTGRHVGRLLATVLDGRVTSVATILGRIDDRGLIKGISPEEIAEQVVTLRAGALPADLEYESQSTVSASLGEASIRAGVLASIGGLALVGLFLLVYYRGMGLNALVSIAMNLLILMALVAFVPVTMTLPGIAGLILTIGMGADSNVLIFERIREELAAGRTARAAIGAGFDRVWTTIVDTHVASLIAAALLFQFGTGPIRGFATTLTMGLLANVFTAVFVSRTLFESRRAKVATKELAAP
jgi:preprotein translocase subunit SecD